MPQTSVSYPIPGSVGRSSRDVLGREHVSLQLLDASAVGFGRAVVYDSANGSGTAKLPSASGQMFLGISIDDSRHAVDQSGGTRYITGDDMLVARKDIVWVEPEQTVVPGDPVYFRHTAKGLSLPGGFRKDADGYVAGTKRVSTLAISGALDGGRGQKETYTLSGAIQEGTGTRRQQTLTLNDVMDAGRKRVQTLTFNQDIVAGEVVDMTIGGIAIDAVTFSVSHSITIDLLINALKKAAAANTSGNPLFEIGISDGGTKRVLVVTSTDHDVAACPMPQANIAITTAAGLTLTQATTVAGVKGSSLTCTIDGGAAIVQEWAGTSDATLQAWADQIAQDAAVLSAVVTKVTDGSGLADADRVITVMSAVASTALVTVFAAASAPGGINARTITVAQTVAGVTGTGSDTFGLTVDGTAITVQQFQGDSDRTMRNIADAIAEAAMTAGAGPAGSPTIERIVVRPVGVTVSDDLVIEIESKPGYPTVFSDLAWTNTTGSGVTCTGVVAVANADPHRLSVQLDGGAALVTEWRGTSDQTLEDFAALIASQAAVESAVVTHLTDTAGTPYGEGDRVITVTAAAVGATQNVFTNPLATGGLVARTLILTEDVVAGVASALATADIIPNAYWFSGGTSGTFAEIQINLP